MILTQSDRLKLLGLATLGIAERKQLNRTEKIVQETLESLGISSSDAESWAGELVYNEGDDPIEAAESAMIGLGLEAAGPPDNLNVP